MSWGSEQFDKVKEFGSLVITIILDSLLVLFVAWLTEFIKTLIESYIIHGKLDSSTHKELWVVYIISQIVVISVCIVYALMDILRHIIKAWKELRK